MTCPGINRSGEPCRATPQRGYLSCPSHRLSVEGMLPTEFRPCRGRGASGDRCGSGAMKGSLTCPKHADQVLWDSDVVPVVSEPAMSVTSGKTLGHLNSLMPMTTRSGRNYTWMLVGKVEISAFGRTRAIATPNLLNNKVQVWWTQPEVGSRWRYLTYLEPR